MRSSFTLGRLLAFLLAVLVVYFLWSYIFVVGGLAPNILLAIVLAIFSIYYFTVHFGNLLDDHLFHGGRKERAQTVRKAQKLLLEKKDLVKVLVRRRKIQNPKELVAQLSSLSVLLSEISKNWKTTEKNRDKQTEDLKRLLVLVDEELKKALGKRYRRHILGGLPPLILALAVALGLRAFFVEPFQIPSGSMIPTLLVGDHLFISKLSYGIVNPFSKVASYFVRWSQPKLGEVIVFEAPHYVQSNAGESWIKRVVAGPGQTVSIKNTIVYVDDKPYPHITAEKLVSYMNYLSTGKRGFWRKSQAIETAENTSGTDHGILLNPPYARHAYENNWPLRSRKVYPGLICDAKSCKVDEGYLFVMGDNRGNSADSRIWGALPIKMVKGRALFIWMSVDSSKSLINISKFSLPQFRWKRWFSWII